MNVQKLWSHLPEFFDILNISNADIESFPHEINREREKEIQEHLDDIYEPFNQRIDAMKPQAVISVNEG